jgi:acyl-CoA synthetase (AMP-forming)/AMP-acid ligase II
MLTTRDRRDDHLHHSFASLVDLLGCRAAEQGQDRAYVFLSERGEETVLTFAELDRRARALAARLGGQGGERALLLFPPGLDFIVAFFGCLVAGVIAVPLMVPRRASSRDASTAIIADCSPRFAVTNIALTASRPDVIDRFRNADFEWVILDASTEAPRVELNVLAHSGAHPVAGSSDIAFLQYTSGSTSDPKGVVVSHGNLLKNLEMIRLAFGNTRRSTYASWVPLYHDMGLILNVLQSLYVGACCVLLAPGTFMQRPMTWLRAIHDYRAEVAGAPNFAFDLCVTRFREQSMRDVDLSCWRLAFIGAEPVRADTLARFTSRFASYGFDARALYPAYGLAEATLLVSGRQRGVGPVMRTVSRDALQRNQVSAPANDDDRQLLIGCGRCLIGERMAIVDPESRQRLPACQVGEIWVSGPNVAHGYWQNAQATQSVFAGRIDGEDDASWLRTGDLGFLDEQGELYVTGRIKDVIIIRGMNHYPQDIENTVQDSHPALARHCGAAFTVLDEAGEEKLIVVQEVERTYWRRIETEDVIGCIREAIANEHEISAGEIVLIRPGSLPKTTSGKIQRNLTRMLWARGKLEVVD